MTMVSFRSFALLAIMILAAPAWAQQGALTVPRNLQQLTDRAATIVRGNVMSARMERHSELGVPMRVVTLQVLETLKGAHRQTFTFREYVWDYRDRIGAVRYRKGDELLLLMIAPSRYGLSSPAGMEQGRFRITRDALGREMAANGHGNALLFDGLAEQAAKEGKALSAASTRLLRQPPRGPIEVRQLAGLIRDLVKQGG